ncbi:MAG: hypothetical protein K6G50_07445 [bacterium]|nr:hypothetical protein [bacterium]
MTTRDAAIKIVNLMNEEQLAAFVRLFQGIVSDIPNDETLAAMEEAEEMLKDPNAKKFSSVQELFADLRS